MFVVRLFCTRPRWGLGKWKRIRSSSGPQGTPSLADGAPTGDRGDWAEGQGSAFCRARRNDFGLGVEGASGRRWLWTQAWKDEEEFVVSIGQREGGRKEGLQSSEGRGERRTLSPGLNPRRPGESALCRVPHRLGSGFKPPRRSLLGCAGFRASARLPVGFWSLADSARGLGGPTCSTGQRGAGLVSWPHRAGRRWQPRARAEGLVWPPEGGAGIREAWALAHPLPGNPAPMRAATRAPPRALGWLWPSFGRYTKNL